MHDVIDTASPTWRAVKAKVAEVVERKHNRLLDSIANKLTHKLRAEIRALNELVEKLEEESNVR